METNALPAGAPMAPGVSDSPNSPANAVLVWLVDDNNELRTMVAELLNEFGGIECARHFSSPDELLSTLASKPGPDVILLDVQMGDRNGLDAVRPIKSLTRATRVLMYTTCSNRAWRERALVDGASDYLLKSETLERIAERIRNPAEDPAPRAFSRPRPSCPSPESKAKHRSAPQNVTQSPDFLTRTLKMLRLFSN